MYYIRLVSLSSPPKADKLGASAPNFFEMKEYMNNLFSFCKEYPVWAAVFFSFGYLIGEIYVV